MTSSENSMRRRYRTPTREDFPSQLKLTIGEEEISFEKAMSLRYGENPHQPAALYRPKKGRLIIGSMKEVKTGKGGLSQTNIQDMNNALSILKFFDEPAATIMKHLNPSGVAAAMSPSDSLKNVYIRARDCDRQAAFGAVVGLNRPIDAETAEEICSTFIEAVIAPGCSDDALKIFSNRKDLRIMQYEDLEHVSKFIEDEPKPLTLTLLMDGSAIVSTPLLTKIRGPADYRPVTSRKPSPTEAVDLIFSWYVCMNKRSNGVVVSKDRATLGIGTGQQDRVTAVRLALEKAVEQGHKDQMKGSVLASDGFFPFEDSVELMGRYGVSACIQPGGSLKDKEVIEACEKYGIAMVFTDERCFRHF